MARRALARAGSWDLGDPRRAGALYPLPRHGGEWAAWRRRAGRSACRSRRRLGVAAGRLGHRAGHRCERWASGDPPRRRRGRRRACAGRAPGRARGCGGTDRSHPRPDHRALDRGGLIDRHEAQADTLADPCAPFVFPTFWLAGALAATGRDGSPWLEAALGTRGRLGLFGEVADPDDHTPLGNYPQVQSHAAFVLAVVAPEASR